VTLKSTKGRKAKCKHFPPSVSGTSLYRVGSSTRRVLR